MRVGRRSLTGPIGEKSLNESSLSSALMVFVMLRDYSGFDRFWPSWVLERG